MSDPQIFNVRNYRAVGDGTTDDLPAFRRALQAMAQENLIQRLPDIPGLSFWPGATLYVPIGRYRLADHLELDRGINLEGVSGALECSGSILRFDGGKGVIVNTQHTSSAGTSGGWSTIRNLRIDAASKVAGNHGIILRARAHLEHVNINNFGGNGIHINTDVRGTNVNNWLVNVCRITGCDGDGLYLRGSDSNAGLCLLLDCTENGGWGIRDESLIGNTYISCHCAGNRLGAYALLSPAARNNSLISCYAEGGQPPSQVKHPAVVLGGIHENGFTRDSGALKILNREFISPFVVHSPQTLGSIIHTYIGSEDSIDSKTALRMAKNDEPGIIFRADGGGQGRWSLGWGTDFPALTICDGGTPPGPGNVSFPRGIHIANGIGQERRISFSTVPPSSGLHTKGDVIFDSEVTNGRNGWRCIATGGWGDRWLANNRPYYVGTPCVPTIHNGYVYRVVSGGGGTGQAEPVWPTVIGQTVPDGEVVWECFGVIPAVFIEF